MSSKRPYGVIDLTDDNSPVRKARRTLPPSFNHSSNGSGPAYPSYVPHASQLVRDEDDEENANVLIDLTQAEDNIGVGFVPVGMIENKVVGVRYYSGFATKGESVRLVREPTNQVRDWDIVLFSSLTWISTTEMRSKWRTFLDNKSGK